VFSNWTGIKLSQIKSVDRDIEHARIIIKNTSGPFTNVNVPIEDDHPLYTKLLLGHSSSYACIIKKTKPSNNFAMCMVTWRSNNRKCTIDLITTYGFNSLYCTACRYQSCLSREFVLVRIFSELSQVLFRLKLFVCLLIPAGLQN